MHKACRRQDGTGERHLTEHLFGEIKLRNAANGETFVFADAGESGRFDVLLEAGGSGGGNALLHVHPRADERFDVRAGHIAVLIDGREQVVGPGETAVVPRGASHCFRNAGEGMAAITISFSPPQRHGRFFLNFAMTAERHPAWFSAKGDPNLLLIALVLHSYRDHLYLARLPRWLQKALFAALAPVARSRGYRLALDP